VSGQVHAPAALPPRKEPPVTIGRKRWALREEFQGGNLSISFSWKIFPPSNFSSVFLTFSSLILFKRLTSRSMRYVKQQIMYLKNAPVTQTHAAPKQLILQQHIFFRSYISVREKGILLPYCLRNHRVRGDTGTPFPTKNSCRKGVLMPF
jgi:hypothetical protein